MYRPPGTADPSRGRPLTPYYHPHTSTTSDIPPGPRRSYGVLPTVREEQLHEAAQRFVSRYGPGLWDRRT